MPCIHQLTDKVNNEVVCYVNHGWSLKICIYHLDKKDQLQVKIESISRSRRGKKKYNNNCIIKRSTTP